MDNMIHYNFINQLKSLPFIDEIWLFGSRARGDHRKKSDIDLAIICPNATDDDWLKIDHIIEEADTLLKIDCINFRKNKISDELYHHILKDKKVIYVKKPH
jgi:predicted nucleotidyltransferase